MEFLHYFGAALGLGLVVIGAGLGIGKLAAAAAEGVARQPIIFPSHSSSVLYLPGLPPENVRRQLLKSILRFCSLWSSGHARLVSLCFLFLGIGKV